MPADAANATADGATDTRRPSSDTTPGAPPTTTDGSAAQATTKRDATITPFTIKAQLAQMLKGGVIMGQRARKAHQQLGA